MEEPIKNYIEKNLNWEPANIYGGYDWVLNTSFEDKTFAKINWLNNKYKAGKEIPTEKEQKILNEIKSNL